jgi:hypothetical protein
MLREESFSPSDEVQVFYEDHSRPVTESMGELVEEILATVSYMFV